MPRGRNYVSLLEGSGHEEVNDKQHRDNDGNHVQIPNGFRLIFFLAQRISKQTEQIAAKVDNHVGKDTEPDTRRNRIAKGHHSDRQEGRYKILNAINFYVLNAFEHQATNPNKSCVCSRAGNGSEYGQKEDRKEEQDSGNQSGKTRFAACGDTRARFYERSNGGSTKQCACGGSRRVRNHNSFIVYGNAVFGHKPSCRAATYASTHGVEHINHTERNNNHNERHNRRALGEYETFGKRRKERAAFGRVEGEEVSEIFPECPGLSRPLGNADTGDKPEQRSRRDTDNNRAFDIEMGKNGDYDKAELDKYLDDAYLAHLTSVRIVHGKGTGALRAGVHNYLRRQKHVASFRLGAFGEGDAGVTIAELK